MSACPHPPEQRWGYPVMWLCCLCYRYFWGAASETPTEDIYGRPK